MKKILWVDAIAGASTGITGLVLSDILVDFLGLPQALIVTIAAITFMYAVFAFILARKNKTPMIGVRVLIYANWAWMVISVGLLICYIGNATIFGAIFLMLQVIVVGLLAWLEGRLVRAQINFFTDVL